jgi:cytochrome c-type biogenesis protein CcmF
VNAPLGLLVAILVALGPLVRWRQEAPSGMGRKALPAAIAGLVAAGLALLLGMRDPLDALLVFGAFFALTANLQVTLKAARRGLPYAAGYVSHLGFALMLVGVIAYSTFGKDKQIALPQGQAVEVLGYQLRYDGKRPQPDGKDRVAVLVTKDGRSFEAEPVIYYSAFNQGMMRNPHVERGVTQDLYIAPIELQAGADALPSVVLGKGQAGEAGGLALQFEEFEREGVMGDPNGFTIRARVKVGEGAAAAIVRPAVKVTPYGLERVPADLPDGGALTLADVDPGSGTARFALRAAGAVAASEVLAVEVSTKPLIGLVWIGMGLLLGGAGLGIGRRLALRRQEAYVRAGAMAHVPAEP